MAIDGGDGRRLAGRCQTPGGPGHTGSAPEVDNGVRRRARLEGSNDAVDGEEVQRSVEEGEGGTLPRAVQRRALGDLVPPLDVGRGQCPQRACHLGDAQVRQMPRFECLEPGRHRR
jgi:hypothetical protein